LIPEEFEINEPPIIHNTIKNNVPSTDLVNVIPELLKLLNIFITVSFKLDSLKVKNIIKDKKTIKEIKNKSS
tara:strand:+ start:92 stop:307 length:216 start_codon:yes stop_codon:yes gene_type:complete